MRRILRLLLAIVLIPVALVGCFLAAALIGGLVPGSLQAKVNEEANLQPQVYLTSNALHADIAIPINSFSLSQFEFLREAGFPLDNPNLEYLVVGWGSQAFYTSTKEYSDIELATVWKAATGDAAVIHVAPAGDVSEVEGITAVPMSEQGFIRLVEFLVGELQRVDGRPVLLEGATFGYGDVFYHAKGHFNLLNPCNVWVSRALAKAGLGAGAWTPTTYSLMVAHALYN